ncbi:hypothetical protein FQN54_003403 [Arachnomyces sp. PD_36]|nr:hypothetical protein FQN54_003403 [Arachnomyces sp. PD_36]
MSLKSIYERFIADPHPSTESVSPDVSLNYITTTTSFNDAGPVTKHLANQKRIVKDISRKTLSSVEGPNSLCLEVETTLEFVSGGGAYLPDLDDNFIADRTVTFATVHIVRFDAQQKINQIRLYWDQGSLLKQVDVIGTRGRTWPIRDSRDQLKLIQKGASAQPTAQTATPSSPPQQTGNNGVSAAAAAQNVSPSKKHIKDPHASLSLFSGQGAATQQEVGFNLPKSSAKPPPRDYGDLFVGGDGDATPTKATIDKPIAPKGAVNHRYKPSRVFSDEPDESAEIDRPISSKGSSNYEYQQSRIIGEDINQPSEEKKSQPDVNRAVPPKGAAGHNYQPSRLFEDDGDDGHPATLYKSHPNKYHHFEFGNGEDGPDLKEKPIRPRSSKHNSQWNFEDFVTPEKPRGKVLSHETRHFGWSDDEGEQAETPPQQPRVRQPRRDAETHFEFQDEATPVAERHINGKTKGTAQNNGMGLYQNNLYGDDGLPSKATEEKAPIAIMPNGVSRSKDFDSHWTMTDTSPAPKDKDEEPKQPVGLDRQKAVKMMDSSWDTYDESPEQPKSTVLPKRASRNPNQRSWGFGDDGDY